MLHLLEKNGWVVFFLAILFSFLIYGESLHNSFVLDDYSVVINESERISFPAIIKTWTNWQPPDQTAFNISRPVSTTIRKILPFFFHGNPIAYHVFNVILFAANATLVFFVMQMLTGGTAISLLTMLFTLFHPLNHIPVNWISGHEILLYSIWALLSVLFYQRYLLSRKRIDQILSVFFMILGFFTQEVTLILVVIFPILDIFSTQAKFRDVVRRLKWHALVGAIYLIFRLIVSSKTIHSVVLLGKIHAGTFLNQCNVIAELFWWYIGKIIFPVDIVFLWTPLSSESTWIAVFTVLILIFIIWYFLTFCRNKYIKLGLVWFFLGLLFLIPLNYVYLSAMGQVIEPHWFFFTLNGLFFALAVWFVELKDKMKPVIWVSIIAILLVGWGALSQSYVQVWKDQGTYGRFWISEVPNNPYAYRGIGEDLARKGKDVDSVDYFKRALMFMDHALLYRLLARSYLEMGDLKQAHENILAALLRRPDESYAHMILGLIYSREGKKDLAIEAMEKAIELDSHELSSKLNLADLFIEKKDYSKARKLLEDVLRINPNHREKPFILLKLIVINYFEKHTDVAMNYIEKYLIVEPAPKGLVSISFMLNEFHASGPAGGILLNCINLYPDYVEAYLLLGVVRGNEERWEHAEKIWNEGQKRFPNDLRFREYLKQLDAIKAKTYAQ